MPTAFMQSTHNTVASLIAIYTGNHGYNNTYAHRTVSFECALQDAWLQLRTGRLRTALICANDEITEFQQQHPHFFGQMDYPDRSEAWMLSVEPGDHALYELENVRIIHQKGGKTVPKSSKNRYETNRFGHYPVSTFMFWTGVSEICAPEDGHFRVERVFLSVTAYQLVVAWLRCRLRCWCGSLDVHPQELPVLPRLSAHLAELRLRDDCRRADLPRNRPRYPLDRGAADHGGMLFRGAVTSPKGLKARPMLVQGERCEPWG